MKTKNHFVPSSYLRSWTGNNNKLWQYALLVSHENVPYWAPKNPSETSYREHLYTQDIDGRLSDDLENWFAREIENPAARVLVKVANGDHLTDAERGTLLRFTALQDIRTPARLIEHIKRTRQTIKPIMEDVLDKAAAQIEAGTIPEQSSPAHSVDGPGRSAFPANVVVKPSSDPDKALLGVEVTPGRATWLYSLPGLLKEAESAFRQHRWKIMKPAKGYVWPTSDNPVIRLNYYNDEHYDFKGGWDREGGDILFPLTPRHLLFTNIGQKSPPAKSRFDEDVTRRIIKVISQSAHRTIFTAKRDALVCELRPREVNDPKYRREQEEWRSWHDEQSQVEREL